MLTVFEARICRDMGMKVVGGPLGASAGSGTGQMPDWPKV